MESPLPNDSDYLEGMIIALEAQRKFLLQGLLDTFNDVPEVCRTLFKSGLEVRKLLKSVERKATRPRLLEGHDDAWASFNGLLIDHGLDPTHVRRGE